MTTEPDFVRALQAMSGPREKGSDFTIVRQGVSVRVRYFSGSSSHIVFSTPYLGQVQPVGDSYRGSGRSLRAVRPMSIELRKEDASDVRAKASGVSIEAQTGDAEFDAAVYIDTLSLPEVVKYVLAAPLAKASVRALLEVGIAPIKLDDSEGLISFRIDSFRRIPDEPAFVLDHLAAIARNVPEVQSSGKAHPEDRWRGVQILSGVLSLLGLAPPLITMFSLLPGRCYEYDDEGTSLACSSSGCCEPLYSGVGLGALFGAVIGAYLFTQVRGTSSAHRVRGWIAFFAFVIAIEALVTITHVLGAITLRS